MANSPYDPPRSDRFAQSLDNLCVWKHCQRATMEGLPVPVALCGAHWMMTGSAFNENPDTHRQAVGRRLGPMRPPRPVSAAERFGLMQKRESYVEGARAKRASSATAPIVYYLRFGNRIKIGTTTNLRQRLMDIPHDEVLATEPGGLGREGERHRTFAHLRIKGEWFSLGPDLLAHVQRLRVQHAREAGCPTP